MYEFPGWFKSFRPHQEPLVEKILDAFDQTSVVILEAPTGTGKTLIAEAVRQRLMAEHNLTAGLPTGPPSTLQQRLADHGVPDHWSQFKTRYLCTTRQLQSQFLSDFPYAALLQGRRNYPTMSPGLFPSISCEDCLKERVGRTITCHWCDPVSSCPYSRAKARAVVSPLAVLNAAYWLREANGSDSQMVMSNFTVVDEADELESGLLGYVEIRIPKWLRERCVNPAPARKTKSEAWQDWLDTDVGPTLTQEIVAVGNATTDAKVKRKRLQRLLYRILEVDVISGRWVMTDSDDVVFKPVWVDRVAKDLIWQHQPKFLLMSATVISSQVMMRGLGLDDHQYTFIAGPSVIPAVRRPVLIRPKVNMSFREVTADPSSWQRMAWSILEVCREWPDVRILVHAVSYKLGKYLTEVLDKHAGRPIVSVGSSRERDSQLARFKDSPRAVLVAPALERGLDLKDDLCRVVIWAKVPFPDTKDPQTSARLYGSGRMGQEWYSVETIRSIVQGAGRGVRGEKDWGVTYILDSQVLRLLNQQRGLWPRWFMEAVDMTGGIASLRVLRRELEAEGFPLSSSNG